jgi:hypothetical protein
MNRQKKRFKKKEKFGVHFLNTKHSLQTSEQTKIIHSQVLPCPNNIKKREKNVCTIFELRIK